MRPRHLERGWCWRADIDGEPAVWGIYGHVDDDEARAIAIAYEGEDLGLSRAVITRDWRRSVPVHPGHACHCEEAGRPHTHMERADGPGRGASPYTWVEVMP